MMEVSARVSAPNSGVIHEVFNTARDKKSSGLALKEVSRAGKTARVIAQHASDVKEWLKVEVLSGPHEGQQGFARQKWICPKLRGALQINCAIKSPRGGRSAFVVTYRKDRDDTLHIQVSASHLNRSKMVHMLDLW